MPNPEIASLEKQIYELTIKLNAMKAENVGDIVPNYQFTTLAGETTLHEMFGDHTNLLVIHNMGQGCRYCTLWADGFNGFLPHLESTLSVVMVSKDPPAQQRQFANSRGWRFQLASHGGEGYIKEQTAMEGQDNMPGAVAYTRDGDTIRRKNSCMFGPGDLYCSAWNLLAMCGFGESNWTPQYTYWRRPEKMDDGGANLPD